MPTAVTMPRLGLSMVEGTVVEWRVRPGEQVTKGQVILEVESEKAEVEVEAFASGVLAALYVDVGTTVPIGTLLGAIVEPGEAFDPAAFRTAFVPEATGTPGPASEARASPALGGSAPAQQAASGVKAAPAARVLARRLGIDLATLVGTGPGGRVTVEDVEAAAKAVVHVNGTGLAVTSVGEGSPVLLVNGYGVDAGAWRPQVEALKAAHALITYDHRGIGHSWPIGQSGLTLGQLAEDAHALLAHLGRAPAVIVGASMGAAVALELAFVHPGAVRGLVLLTPVVLRDARLEVVLRSWLEHELPASEARIRAMLPWLLGRELLAHPGKRAAAAAAFRAMAARTPTAALRHHAEALLAWLGTRAGELGRVHAPTLVVAGADDVLVACDHAEALAAGIGGARLEVLAGSGHAVALERAEAVNRLVGGFAAARG
jgi:pyruvate dehydrogenase E2 component (dihydrolipoamide acetyltransferase)